jgi:hypothetical protein
MDGTPRTIAIWFHWDGEAMVFATRPRAQKLIALRANPEVAITIDEHVLPYKILYLRGVASIELLDDVPLSTSPRPNATWASSKDGLIRIGCGVSGSRGSG